MRGLTASIEPTALRRSITWIRVLPIVPAVILESQQPSHGRPMRIAAMAFCLAAPMAAASFLEAEQTGRLDQLRLSGQTPAAMARQVFAAGTIWVGVGGAALLWALLSNALTPYGLLVIATMALVTTTAGAIASTTPMVRDQIDPRISTAGLTVAAVAMGATTAGLLRVAPPARYFWLAMVPLLVLLAERVRHVPARLAYPVASELQRAAVFRPNPHEWIVNWPGFYRGWCLSASGVVLFTIGAPILFLGWWLRTTPYRGDTAPFYAAPLLIGLFAISLICREDVTKGRLDVVRQSSRRPALAAIEMIAGLWFPFVLASAGLAAVTSLLFGVSVTGLQVLAVLAIVVAPLPAIEGWSTHWPMMTVLPFALAMTTSRAFDAPWILPVLVALVWYAAVRLFENPSRPVLAGIPAVIVPAVICAGPAFGTFILFDPVMTATWMSGVLFLTSQLLIDPQSRRDVRWGQPIAVAVTVLITFGAVLTWQDALWAATLVVLAWFCAYRVRQIRPGQPAIQAGIRLAAMVGWIQLESLRFQRGTPLLDVSEPATALIVTIAAAVLSELGYRISVMTARRKLAPATPLP